MASSFLNQDKAPPAHSDLAEGDNVLSFGEGIQKVDIHVSAYAIGLKIDYGVQGGVILPGTASADDTVFCSSRPPAITEGHPLS